MEADYSTPLAADGRWTGRSVAAHEDGGSSLRDAQDKRDFLYGATAWSTAGSARTAR